MLHMLKYQVKIFMQPFYWDPLSHYRKSVLLTVAIIHKYHIMELLPVKKSILSGLLILRMLHRGLIHQFE